MFHRGLTYMLCAVLALSAVNPAVAKEKKKGSGIIKKAIAAYVVYRVIKHYKNKKEEEKAKNKYEDRYVESYYDEECEDEDECEEE